MKSKVISCMGTKEKRYLYLSVNMETFFNKNKHDKKKSLYTFEWFPHGWMVLKCSRTFKIRCTQGGSSNLFKTCLSIDD